MGFCNKLRSSVLASPTQLQHRHAELLKDTFPLTSEGNVGCPFCNNRAKGDVSHVIQNCPATLQGRTHTMQLLDRWLNGCGAPFDSSAASDYPAVKQWAATSTIRTKLKGAHIQYMDTTGKWRRMEDALVHSIAKLRYPLSPLQLLSSNNIPPEAITPLANTATNFIGGSWRSTDKILPTKSSYSPSMAKSVLFVDAEHGTPLRRALQKHKANPPSAVIVVNAPHSPLLAAKWAKIGASCILNTSIDDRPCMIFTWEKEIDARPTWLAWLKARHPRAIFSATKVCGRPFLSQEDWDTIFKEAPAPRHPYNWLRGASYSPTLAWRCLIPSFARDWFRARGVLCPDSEVRDATRLLTSWIKFRVWQPYAQKLTNYSC